LKKLETVKVASIFKGLAATTGGFLKAERAHSKQPQAGGKRAGNPPPWGVSLGRVLISLLNEGKNPRIISASLRRFVLTSLVPKSPPSQGDAEII